jgi:hypothetical protein
MLVLLLLLLLLLLLECNSRSLAIHHLLMKIMNKRRRDEAEITENTHTERTTHKITTTPFLLTPFCFGRSRL